MTVARGLMTSLGLNGFTHPVGGEVVVHRLRVRGGRNLALMVCQQGAKSFASSQESIGGGPTTHPCQTTGGKRLQDPEASPEDMSFPDATTQEPASWAQK